MHDDFYSAAGDDDAHVRAWWLWVNEKVGPRQLLEGDPGALRLKAGKRSLARLLCRLRAKGLSAHEVVLVLESAMRQAEYDRNHRTRNKKP